MQICGILLIIADASYVLVLTSSLKMPEIFAKAQKGLCAQSQHDRLVYFKNVTPSMLYKQCSAAVGT